MRREVSILGFKMTNTNGAAVLSTTTNVQCQGAYSATTTRVVFTYGPRRYVAIRFERTDTGCSGTEVYTATSSEYGDEFLGYAEASPTALKRIAGELVRRACLALVAPVGATERAAALEWDMAVAA